MRANSVKKTIKKFADFIIIFKFVLMFNDLKINIYCKSIRIFTLYVVKIVIFFYFLQFKRVEQIFFKSITFYPSEIKVYFCSCFY